MPNLITVGQTAQAYVQRSAGNIEPLGPPFKVIQDRRNWHGSIGYLWLPTVIYHVTFPSRWRCRKTQIFPIACIGVSPLADGGYPGNIITPFAAQETRMLA